MQAIPGRAFILTTFLFFCGTLNAAQEAMDYYFAGLTFRDDMTTRQYETLQLMLRNGQFNQARVAADILIDDNLHLANSQPVLFGKMLTNLGIILAYQEEYIEAMQALDLSLQTIEESSTAYTYTLKKVVMVRGLVQSNLRLFGEAEESFRRAQHITHRIGGVYSPDQLEVIRHIIKLDVKQGKLPDADREQEFSLRINEQIYGDNSEDLLPILQRLGAYFASRGSMYNLAASPDFRYYRDQMFRQSIGYYERSLEIIEGSYGVNDLRLVEPLRGLARARTLQVTNRSASEAALERVLSIISNNPDTDLSDQIGAMVGLADTYTITGDRRAAQTYLNAWQLMQADPVYDQLSAEIFGTPTRLHPAIDGILYLDRRPDSLVDGNAELFIEITYSVHVDGRVSNMVLIDKNVPNAQVRYVRSKLADTRFRPRILEGELVVTDNLMIHQTFEVIHESLPTSSSSGENSSTESKSEESASMENSSAENRFDNNQFDDNQFKNKSGQSETPNLL